jgi:3-hydroxybutyryl-CoA dehydrogenase
MTEFRKAAAIGTGMMGPGIAVTFALGGLEATIVSRTDEGARAGVEKAQAQLSELSAHGLADEREALEAAGRIRGTSNLEESCGEADIVVESAPENLEFKQELFARLDAIARPDAVLATNTSGLSITAVASRCVRPERVMTAHFWNPPHVMPLVELVKGEQTSRELMEEVRALLVRCGKTPVMVEKDRRGQLGNRLQMALWREAVHIVEEGIATAAEVDLAARMGFGLRLPALGIFEHADAVGLNMVADIMNYVSADLYSERKAPPLLGRMVEEGSLGVKSGKGFYDWSQKSFEEVRRRRDGFLYEVLAARKRKAGE